MPNDLGLHGIRAPWWFGRKYQTHFREPQVIYIHYVKKLRAPISLHNWGSLLSWISKNLFPPFLVLFDSILFETRNKESQLLPLEVMTGQLIIMSARTMWPGAISSFWAWGLSKVSIGMVPLGPFQPWIIEHVAMRHPPYPLTTLLATLRSWTR